jgi:4-hydroxy-3-methylbut-2-enyl diphosphate reductase
MTDSSRSLEVVVAKAAGTCFGVEAAIRIAEEERQPILGPLVHNRQIVQNLSESGIPILERYQDLEELGKQGIQEVIITAHGYPKELKEQLTGMGIQYHDATCPVLLKWFYGKIRRFESDGYSVILVGNPTHAEIVASRSYGTNIHTVYAKEDVEKLPDGLGKTVAFCQTTITAEKFHTLVDLIRQTKYPELRAVDTRCKPVKNQQEAVERLAQWVDAMLIVGGKNSSNTASLAKIAARYLPERTYHIDSADEIRPEWIAGASSLGIGGGTSTPKSQIQEVKERIAQLHPGPVHFRRDGEVDDGPDDADVSTEI